jgi:hypothetical protein
MKKKTYRILRAIPIVGGFVEDYYKPLPIYGSAYRESGLSDELSGILNEYRKKHPDEQITGQLMRKLFDEYYKEKNK